jgi:class 3 adenylate cyclase
VLGEHQRLLRAAFDEHDGREVHTEGDAIFVAFARPPSAAVLGSLGTVAPWARRPSRDR